MPRVDEGLALAAHATYLIAPFRHGLATSGSWTNAKSLESKWRTWWHRLSKEDIERAAHDGGFFLGYVKGILAPESVLGDGKTSIAQLAERLPAHRVLRLTLTEEEHAKVSRLTLTSKHASLDKVAIDVPWIDLVLYPSGVGFLVMKLQLAEWSNLSTLVRVSSQARTFEAPSLGWELAKVHVDGRDSTMKELVTKLLGDAAQPLGYGRAQLLTFACADVPPDLERGDFPSAEDRLGYELATCVGVDATIADPTWAPSGEQVSSLLRTSRFAPWRVWRAFLLKECFGLLATQASPFTTRALPRTIEGIYLPLYLYALHQREMLTRFSDALVARVADGDLELGEVRRLVDAFVDFRHRYWLGEVTRRPLGGDLYRKMQQGLEVTALFDLAARAAQDVKSFHEERRSQRMAILVNILTFGFGPLGAATTIAALLVPDASRHLERAASIVAVLTAIWITLAIVWRRAGRPASAE